MSQQVNDLQIGLVNTLEELVKHYRALLETVRQEREILISSQLDDLNQNNRTKESIIVKIQTIDQIREVQSKELAVQIGIQEEPRLLEIARHSQGDISDRFRNFHSVLEILIKRVQELNKENEILVQSALQLVTGAMKSIKDEFQDKPTYERRGEVKASGATGNLVSREA